MVRPSFTNEGKPPLLVEHAGGRGREQKAEALRSLFRWQAGDLLVLDNVLAAHARMPFSGARRVLLAMT